MNKFIIGVTCLLLVGCDVVINQKDLGKINSTCEGGVYSVNIKGNINIPDTVKVNCKNGTFAEWGLRK